MPPSTTASVGIWIEPARVPLPAARDDPRIRHARGLLLGLDALPEIELVVVPCLPKARGLVEELFAEAGRPLSRKLRVVAAGRDAVWRAAIATWAERRLAACRERLAGSGCDASPRSWSRALALVAAESPGRPLKALQRLARVVRLAARYAVLSGILAVIRALPPAHASMIRDLRRRSMAMPWLVPWWEGGSGTRLPGPKFLDLGGRAPADGIPGEACPRDALERLVAAAAVTIVPSMHAAGRSGPSRVVLIPPPIMPAGDDGLDEATSRLRLADELRASFSGSDGRPAHRHFCDFPFERIEYLLVPPPMATAGPILQAYAAILRRHRRDLKLVVDGRLPAELVTRGEPDHASPPHRGGEWRADPREWTLQAPLHALGLVFDVIEATGLSEAARARLVRHARAVVIPTEQAGALPAVFTAAVTAGRPVASGRLSVMREALPAADLTGPEYFEIGAAGEMERAILHVLDHPAEVVARQAAIRAALEPRGWPAVAADYLAVMQVTCDLKRVTRVPINPQACHRNL